MKQYLYRITETRNCREKLVRYSLSAVRTLQRQLLIFYHASTTLVELMLENLMRFMPGPIRRKSCQYMWIEEHCYTSCVVSHSETMSQLVNQCSTNISPLHLLRYQYARVTVWIANWTNRMNAVELITHVVHFYTAEVINKTHNWCHVTIF